MPLKPANSPDFACKDCGRRFRDSAWRRLLDGLRRRPPFPKLACPACGSRNIGILQY